MAGSKVLVLGGTGPAGISLLRELVHRKKHSVVYARTPTKIPDDLSSSSYLEIIKGEMDDATSLSDAVSKCDVVLSLLGPTEWRTGSPTRFADMYRSLWTAMREHGVTRIYAMGTFSIEARQDAFSLISWLTVWLVYIIAIRGWQNVVNIGKAFSEEAQDLDWTVYRIGWVFGGSDSQSWAAQRGGQVFEGWVNQPGWSGSITRGELARWLVDGAEGNIARSWSQKMPAISSMSASGKSKAN